MVLRGAEVRVSGWCSGEAVTEIGRFRSRDDIIWRGFSILTLLNVLSPCRCIHVALAAATSP